MTPPPGWYRDPSDPYTERWWDGTAWTDHRRAAQLPQAVPEQSGFWPSTPQGAPAQQGFGPPVLQNGTSDQGGSGGPRAKALAIIVAGAVLIAAIVTGVVVLGTGDGDPEAAVSPTASGSAHSAEESGGTPSGTPSESASEPSADDPSMVVDELNGITFPLLDGWVRPQYTVDDDVVMTTDGTYDCPGDSGVCRHGTVVSRTVTANDEKSPEALAKEDIDDAADRAYDRDAVNSRPFNGIVSHQQVKAGPVAVAGRTGYFVRWRVRTEVGPGGYVQSLAFPSSVGSESMVIVRFAFDAGEDGPPLGDMDRITKGIRPINDADTGGGVGSSIGPTQ
ncbi:DUF2510 domain-containing protein [Streptomyces sp. NPDC002896]|uniref:DUF2510 domain-containing protein n=1 Tax=Streptomyces sp. NPDC002896 TaxID=3154438 RepID=UPI003330A402